VLVHPKVFESYRQLQKGQVQSPRFDLGDLVTAGLMLALAGGDPTQALLDKARSNFVQNI
jgi:hypothetical protein